MTILETRRLDDFGNQPQNYLYDWARRTNNVSNLANFTVDVTQDEGTGFQYGSIRAVGDLPPVDPVIDTDAPPPDETPEQEILQ